MHRILYGARSIEFSDPRRIVRGKFNFKTLRSFETRESKLNAVCVCSVLCSILPLRGRQVKQNTSVNFALKYQQLLLEAHELYYAAKGYICSSS